MYQGKLNPVIVSGDEKLRLLRLYEKNIVKDDSDKCWMWKNRSWNSYPRISTSLGNFTAHRVVYELFHGLPTRERPYIRHKCDNRGCLNPNHLISGTMRDNALDRRLNKKALIISDKDILVIKYMRSLEYTYDSIASMFGCSISTIREFDLGVRSPTKFPKSYHSF